MYFLWYTELQFRNYGTTKTCMNAFCFGNVLFLTRDYSKHFDLLAFLHRRLSFLVTFYAPMAAAGKALRKFLIFASTGPLKTYFYG